MHPDKIIPASHTRRKSFLRLGHHPTWRSGHNAPVAPVDGKSPHRQVEHRPTSTLTASSNTPRPCPPQTTLSLPMAKSSIPPTPDVALHHRRRSPAEAHSLNSSREVSRVPFATAVHTIPEVDSLHSPLLPWTHCQQ
jgi:hypothetical protein